MSNPDLVRRLNPVADRIVQLRVGRRLAGGWLGLAIAASMTMAAVVGAAVPMVIKRVGFDPAIATGPVVTTALDVVGVASYFFIAAMLLG